MNFLISIRHQNEDTKNMEFKCDNEKFACQFNENNTTQRKNSICISKNKPKAKITLCRIYV